MEADSGRLSENNGRNLEVGAQPLVVELNKLGCGRRDRRRHQKSGPVLLVGLDRYFYEILCGRLLADCLCKREIMDHRGNACFALCVYWLRVRRLGQLWRDFEFDVVLQLREHEVEL